MKRRWVLAAVLLATAATALEAQSAGIVRGQVTDVLNGVPVAGAEVVVGDGPARARTDTEGRYLIRDVRPGMHQVTARAVGFVALTRDSIVVSGGQITVVDFAIVPEAVALPGVEVEAQRDQLLDPRQPQVIQHILAAELRELPVTTLEEAVELQAGVVSGSFRGGRLGQDALVVDGLGIKNQLDASTGRLGLQIPIVALEEAALVTNAFSAQYGQALSGVITAVTRDGGDRLEGRVAYESDRLLPDGWDVGLDRVTAAVGGPVAGGVRFFAAADAQARIDDDPVAAPAPEDPLDPRHARPWLLPHNAGERADVLAKLTLPLGAHHEARLLGVASESQRELYDPVLKYAPGSGAAERLSGRFGLLHLRHASSPSASTSLDADLRIGYFEKEQIRGPLLEEPTSRFGAATFEAYAFAGRDLARARDTVTALHAIPGVERPEYVEGTPWGVPAFFMTTSPRGEVAWNRFREGRARLDVLLGGGLDTDLRLGGEYVRQRVETFTRLEAYLAVAEGAPAPSASGFSPYQGSAYLELQHRASDVTLTAGLRADLFDARVETAGIRSKTKFALGPRLAVSTVLGPATVVASWGRFAQPPDFQYLADAAFDDTLRTGRFRRGNPTLGFESSMQYEFQVRARPSPYVGLRIGVFVKRLDGLVASVPLGLDPDSSIFGNGDYGDVRGLEITVEREFRGDVGVRATYVMQQAEATATDARDLFRRLQIVPSGDTVIPATVQFPLDFDRRHAVIVVGRARVPRSVFALRGTEAALVGRWSSGLPYTRTNLGGDSILGLPNSNRLPPQFTLDLLLRRSVMLGGLDLGVFADVRNATGRRNLVAVRRDNGEAAPGEGIVRALAEHAYEANPYPIPYESPRYRAWADADGDGLVAGREELMPLFERAARDLTQPIFPYAAPRLVRIGVEIAF